jgi:hypothetical protein
MEAQQDQRMNRREFIKGIAAGIIGFGVSNPTNRLTAKEPPQVSITMDDPNLFDTPIMQPVERNRAILKAMSTHSNLKGALFVCGKHLDSPEGAELL